MVDRIDKKILPLGDGEFDVALLKTIKDSGYQGPIGILGHVANRDVEVVLKENLDGLHQIVDKLNKKYNPPRSP